MGTHEASMVLRSGYGCFALFGAEPCAQESLDDRLLEWFELGFEDPPILTVKAGAQFGPYALTIRIGRAEPQEADEAIWEDVAEVSVVCGDQLALGDLEDGWGQEVAIDEGTYRLRVSAAGRTESAAREGAFPDDETSLVDEGPLERFLLELWPAPFKATAVVREDSQFAAKLTSPPAPDHPPEREPGLQAARIVAEDLRRCGTGGTLSGQLGELLVTMTFAGTPTRIFNRVKLANGWPPGNGGSPSANDNVGDHCAFYGDPPDSDGLAPLLGMVHTTVLEIDKPRRIVRSWNWRVAGPDGMPYPSNPRLLEHDSTVVMTVAKANIRGEDATTTVTVHHTGVPVEWLAAQQSLWQWSAAEFARR